MKCLIKITFSSWRNKPSTVQLGFLCEVTPATLFSATMGEVWHIPEQASAIYTGLGTDGRRVPGLRTHLTDCEQPSFKFKHWQRLPSARMGPSCGTVTT